MTRSLTALALGLLFGLGLIVSGMSNPAKVLAFLDITGRWDPSLAFVMAGAVLVSAAGHVLARRRRRPVFADAFDIPTRRSLDLPLISGAVIFGIGWGLAGLCPGPALTLLAVVPGQAAIFVAAMLVGMLLVRMVPRQRPPSQAMTAEAEQPAATQH